MVSATRAGALTRTRARPPEAASKLPALGRAASRRSALGGYEILMGEAA